MRRLLLTSAILISVVPLSNADMGTKHKPDTDRKVRIAIIDTGIDPKLFTNDSLCTYGHKDFTGTGLKDNHGHGTHISGIIDQYAKDFIVGVDGDGNALDKKKLPSYCQVIIKFYDSKADGDTLSASVKAFKWAIRQHVDIINYSGGGDYFYQEEYDVIEEALNAGITIVAAAGNDGRDIDKQKYYPAMYDKRIYVVGNLVDTKTRVIAPSSNYGKGVNSWELGTKVLSRALNGQFGYMTGTSQATAVKSGKLVRQMVTKRSH